MKSSSRTNESRIILPALAGKLDRSSCDISFL